MKAYLARCFFPLLLFSLGQSNAQHKAQWTSNPFDQRVFIENKGQLVSPLDKAKYSVRHKGTEIYFFPEGIVYRHVTLEKISERIKERFEEAKDEKDNAKLQKLAQKYTAPVVSTLSMEWVGSNPLVEIIAEEPVENYFTYADADDKNPSAPVTFTAKAFRKITYKNIYPGIDVVYTMPEGSDKIKYAIILHPGSNSEDIKMKYPDATGISLSEQGDLHIKSSFGNFIDQAPETFYKIGGKIKSGFILDKSTVSFYLDHYSANLEVIIDPWTTFPTFAGNGAFDIDFDNNGNVFVYGGSYPWSVIKFNNAGVIQWTFTPFSFDGFYGDFFVDHLTGRTYISEGWNTFGGAQIVKVSPAGALLATFPGLASVDEIWRMVYNPCTGDAILGCGNTAASYQTMMLDTNFLSFTPVNTLVTTETHHDITMMALDGNTAYGLTPTSLASTSFDNLLFRIPVPALAPMTWSVTSGHSFYEFVGPTYVNSSTCGYNGIAVRNFLYTQDGATLKQWNKTTGALISNTFLSALGGYVWAGLDVDECENLYVGVENQVKVFNSSLTLVTTYNFSAYVFDLKLGIGNKLYVCGQGFVSSLDLPGNPITLTSTPSNNCPGCNGTATITTCSSTSTLTYLWTPGGQTTATATGLCPGLYTASVFDNCNLIFQDTITVQALPSITVNANFSFTTACLGQSTVFTDNSTTSSGSIIGWVWNFGDTFTSSLQNPTHTYSAPGNYTVTLTVTANNGCTATFQATVTVSPLPAVSVSPASTICTGQSATLTATGANTYSWSPSATLSSSIGSSVTATPSSTITYTVTGDLNGCTATAQTTITVNPLPVVSVTPASTICTGQSSTLTASGANTYSWSPSSTLSSSIGSSVTATPSSTIIYTVTGDLNGCTATAQTTVTVNPLPVMSVSPASTICTGQSSTLTASGANTYSWSPSSSLSASIGSSVTANPTSTTTYTVTGDLNGCTATAQTTVTVNPLPVVSVTPASTICTGQSSALTASGANTYSWSPSASLSSSIGSSVTATPTSTTTYTVTGDLNGCTATIQTTVTVNPLPVVSVSPASTICTGQSSTLTASGANTYSWSPSATLSSSIGSSVTANPTSTTTYTVTGDLNGCTATAQTTVTVNPLPVVSVTPASTICTGQSSTLTASGANTYSWSPSASLSASIGSSVTANPTSTTTYTVTGDLNGCTATAQTTVTVNPLPVVSVTPASTICTGQSTTLTASGANTYSWSPSSSLSSSTGSSVSASPSSTTTYTVTGNLNGCTATAQTTVTVNPLPVLTISPSFTICTGQSTTLTASGANTYSWSPSSSLSSSTGSSVSASPSSTTTYTVTGNLNGCTATAQTTITVNSFPAVSVSPALTICTGQSATLTATGANTYTWSPSASLSSSTGTSVTANPTSTTTYTVTGDLFGCTATVQTTVTVNPLPVVSVSPASTICDGQSATLTASGANTYSWSPSSSLSSSTGSSVSANPTSTTTYTITGDLNGCTATSQTTVTVNPLPVVSVSPASTICTGQSSTLTASGANTYTWSPSTSLSASTGSNVTANPASTITYTVTGDLNGCTSTAQTTVTVNPYPIVSVSPASNICLGQSTTLNASGANTYSWNPSSSLSSSTGSSVIATPTSTTAYTVTGDLNGCTATAQTVVVVSTTPAVTVSPDDSVCYGQSSILIASGASTYSWSPAWSLNTSTGSNVIASPDSTTTYTVTGSQGGCDATTQVTVSVTLLPVVMFTPPAAACAPLHVQFIDGSIVASGSTYFWNFGDSSTSVLKNPGHTFLQAGTYNVTLTISSPPGCTNSVTATVIVYPNPVADYEATPVTAPAGTKIQFTDQSYSNIVSWDWNFGDGFGTSIIQHPEYVYNWVDNFIVALVVTNIHGCVDSAWSTVIITEEEFEVWIPNVFSPNHDHSNDVFNVSGIGIEKFDMVIFDRWGMEIFHTMDKEEGWNGRMYGNGVECLVDTYVYLIKVWDGENKEHRLIGHVTLLR